MKYGGRKIQQVSVDGIPYFCAWARSDPDDPDVRTRPSISQKEAKEIVKGFLAQRNGVSSSIDVLQTLAGSEAARVFWVVGGSATCSCPAFYHPRQCFHTLGLKLKLRLIQIPEDLDPTPVGVAARGNKPKAAHRRSMPLKADEKDLLICQLKSQLHKMQKTKASQNARSTDGTPSAAPSNDPTDWIPQSARTALSRRRLRGKQTVEPPALVQDTVSGVSQGESTETDMQRPLQCTTECETAWVLEKPTPDICELLGYELANLSDVDPLLLVRRGLCNLGLTCWLNALLSALYNVDTVRAWARQHHEKCEILNKTLCPLCCLAIDFAWMSMPKPAPVSAPATATSMQIWSKVAVSSSPEEGAIIQPQFRIGRQSCIAEAFRILVQACTSMDESAFRDLGGHARSSTYH